MEKVNKENLSWLISVPASDVNFSCKLQDSNIETCTEALKNNELSKLARKKIESRIKHLNTKN